MTKGNRSKQVSVAFYFAVKRIARQGIASLPCDFHLLFTAGGFYQYIPPPCAAIAAAAAASAFGSGMSATRDSVVSTIAATDEAF